MSVGVGEDGVGVHKRNYGDGSDDRDDVVDDAAAVVETEYHAYHP